MNILKDLKRSVNSHHFLGLLGLFFVIMVLSQYSTHKGTSVDAMSANNSHASSAPAVTSNTQFAQSSTQPANPAGHNEDHATVNFPSSANNALPGCTNKPVTNPSELLPKDTNSQWAALNPTGNGDLKNVNFLKAGYHTGIDTIGTSLRNANLQVRSEPANPQNNVSPWNQSTISPDLMRTPLELGCGPQ